MQPQLNEKLRAWWAHRQGLDGALAGAAPAEVLGRTGWARSVGGVGPYLTLFARAGTTREAADQGVANLEIHELPSVRGCTYVLPAADFALGLKAGQSFAGADMKVAAKLGVTDKEVAKLCEAVLKALANGPLEPEAIREATGDIRRIPMNGRPDQQRYKYVLCHPKPLAKFTMPAEEVQTELARRYFQW